ncbi:MAG: Zn-dependent hydrolase [Porticoccaceae bacterium]|nr:MAG: Zn-dependent hydrolase [Porticoccaceae bacterium]
MIFRQLFEPLSSTYTYLLGCSRTRRALLIDPVYPTVERDLAVLAELGLTLECTLETHVHADHITGARALREATGCRVGYPRYSGVACADFDVADGDRIEVGEEVRLTALYTPGHTDDHLCYLWEDRLFSGDTLLIDGCGRTDFQNGDAATLYDSIRERLFALPDDTLVYPGHDYQKRRVSTIRQEKDRNPRVGGDRSREAFIALMAALDLPYPRFIDHAVPGNRACGRCPEDLPEQLAAYCRQMSESVQG